MNISIPPHVQGKVFGSLTFKLLGCELLDGSQPVGAKIRFQWWGYSETPILLAVPWKNLGNSNELIFPLHSSKKSIIEYMDDMSELFIDLIDSNNKCIGKSVFSLNKFAKSDLKLIDIIEIFKSQTSSINKKVLGKLKLELCANFEPVQPKLVTSSEPEPPERKPLRVIKKDESGVLNSFQKFEVKILVIYILLFIFFYSIKKFNLFRL